MRALAPWLLLVLLASPLRAQDERPEPKPIKPFRTQTHEAKVPIAWNRLYSNKELVKHFERLAAAYPRLARWQEIGKSAGGRPLYVMTISNPKTGPAEDKAAMFIDANIHGNEVQCSETCLYTAWLLLTYYGKIDRLTRLVDERVIYLQPVTNVDARVHWFNKPSTPHWPRRSLNPVDDDRDGVADEDGFDDLDGDGEITQMRKKVPLGEGTHRLDPDDPRILVRVASDEQGDYLMLGAEGKDNDGDGRINEDLPGGVDMNRNWPGDWRPEHLQGGAGLYPLSRPETRAVARFVLARPHIAGYQSYHNAGGMILRGPGNSQQPAYTGEEKRIYDSLGRAGVELLPHYRYLIIWKDLYSVYGGEVTWAAEDLGIFAFTNELWTPARLAKGVSRRGGGQDAQRTRLRVIDRLLAGEVFAPWKAFDHPQHGKIEIGGLKQMYGRVPPSFLLEEGYHRNSLFTLHHADSMPLVKMGNVTVSKLGRRRFQIDAWVHNPKLIPTRTPRMVKHKIGRKDMMRLDVRGATIVAGGKLHGGPHLPRWVPKGHDPGRLWFDEGIGSYGRVGARWLVTLPARGEAEVVVSFRAEKGGVVQRKLSVR